MGVMRINSNILQVGSMSVGNTMFVEKKTVSERGEEKKKLKEKAALAVINEELGVCQNKEEEAGAEYYTGVLKKKIRELVALRLENSLCGEKGMLRIMELGYLLRGWMKGEEERELMRSLAREVADEKELKRLVELKGQDSEEKTYWFVANEISISAQVMNDIDADVYIFELMEKMWNHFEMKVSYHHQTEIEEEISRLEMGYLLKGWMESGGKVKLFLELINEMAKTDSMQQLLEFVLESEENKYGEGGEE